MSSLVDSEGTAVPFRIVLPQASEDGAAGADRAGQGGQIWPMVTYDLTVLVGNEINNAGYVNNQVKNQMLGLNGTGPGNMAQGLLH